MKHFQLMIAVVLLALPSAALAEPYWVAWEGNDYPENEGWTRVHYGENGPTAVRSLNNGIMILDGLESVEIIDAYRVMRRVDPSPGEMFVVQWGMRVDEVRSVYPYDPGIEITSDDGWGVSLVIGDDEVHSILEQRYLHIDLTGFLAWELRSPDMRNYSLSINGVIADEGVFRKIGILESRVDWGDIVAGAASQSEWDYFRFGVIPEPNSFILAIVLVCAKRANLLIRRIQ